MSNMLQRGGFLQAEDGGKKVEDSFSRSLFSHKEGFTIFWGKKSAIGRFVPRQERAVWSKSYFATLSCFGLVWLKDTSCTCTQSQSCKLSLRSLWELCGPIQTCLSKWKRRVPKRHLEDVYFSCFSLPKTYTFRKRICCQPKGCTSGVTRDDAPPGMPRWGSNLCVSCLIPETCHCSNVNSWGQCEPSPADERPPSCWVFGEITPTKPLQASTECLQPFPPGNPEDCIPPCLQFVCVAPLRIDMLDMNGDNSKRLNRPQAPPTKKKTNIVEKVPYSAWEGKFVYQSSFIIV